MCRRSRHIESNTHIQKFFLSLALTHSPSLFVPSCTIVVVVGKWLMLAIVRCTYVAHAHSLIHMQRVHTHTGPYNRARISFRLLSARDRQKKYNTSHTVTPNKGTAHGNEPSAEYQTETTRCAGIDLQRTRISTHILYGREEKSEKREGVTSEKTENGNSYSNSSSTTNCLAVRLSLFLSFYHRSLSSMNSVNV